MKKLYELTIEEASKKLDDLEFPSVELTEAIIQRIEEKEPEINAFITVSKDYALEKAYESDESIVCGERRSILEGIPYSIKDAYVTKGIQTTA
ncbi:MAG: amidase family protein, partial [bacterium]